MSPVTLSTASHSESGGSPPSTGYRLQAHILATHTHTLPTSHVSLRRSSHLPRTTSHNSQRIVDVAQGIAKNQSPKRL